MSEIFISYARSTETQARQVADALRALGYGVWRDVDLPAHKPYAGVIAERLDAAKAVVVIWSADAAKSEWVQSEADQARAAQKLVQLTLDGAKLPMPFDRIQCADLAGWTGDLDAPGWRKVVASIADLIGAPDVPAEGPPAVTAASPPIPKKPSIAVLPFANLSGDREQEYFVDGMVVEITNALSRFKSLFVIASSSTFALKGTAFDAQEVARRLGVRYLLEGSVRKAANRVRIAVQLVSAADGAQIWSHSFEDTLEDVFDLQDRVALGVAGKIEPTVQMAEIRHASARPTADAGSYDLFLRAVPLFRLFTKAGVLAALDLLDRALMPDPDYGSALVLAAICHQFIAIFGWSDEPADHRRLGVELAHRALRVSSDDAGVLAAAAGVLSGLGEDAVAALALVERAIALNPGSALVWLNSGSIHMVAGETEIAIEHLERSMRLDPMGADRANSLGLMGLGRFRQERFGDAVALFNESAQQLDSARAHAYLAASYGHLGQKGAAREALDRFRTLSPQPIVDYARSAIHDPVRLKLFLDGIALAEVSPQDVAALPRGARP